MYCSIKKVKVMLDKNLECACTSGLKRGVCTGAGIVEQEVYIGDYMISYNDFEDKENNTMFCIENIPKFKSNIE